MKKFMLVALSFAMSSMIFAHGVGYNSQSNTQKEGFWKDMNQVHELMHNTSIKGEKLDKGVSFEITASADTTIESIKRRFIEEKEALNEYFNSVEVSVSTLDNGVNIKLESVDENTVKRLQYYGPVSIYRYLHGSVFKNQNGMGFHGMMGHHGGFGHGMMHGYGMGYGPGMMNEWDQNNEGNTQSYRWDNHMGYGPGMM